MEPSFLWEVSFDREAHPAELRSISLKPLNPSAAIIYGYSVYTSFKYPLADIWLQKHQERLEQNAHQMGLEWQSAWNFLFSQAWLSNEVKRIGILPIEDKISIIFRYTVFADINEYPDFYKQPHQTLPSCLVISTRPAPETPRKAVSLKRVYYERPFPTVKRGDLMESIRLKREARMDSFDDVLFVNRQGHITEASTANIFLMGQDGVLYTPDPEQSGCLPGITRQRVLEVAKHENIPICDNKIVPSESLDDSKEAISFEGAFLTNAVQGLVPLARIEGYQFPWTNHTQERFAQILKTM